MQNDAEHIRVRGSGTQSVYVTLRREILSMALEPGSPLDEVRLSERFGMSRTPIREALLRLAAACYPSVDMLMPLSGIAWSMAFLFYVLCFGGMLVKSRKRSAVAA